MSIAYNLLISYGPQDIYLLDSFRNNTSNLTPCIRNRNTNVINKIKKSNINKNDYTYIEDNIYSLFDMACENGYIDVAKFLYDLSIKNSKRIYDFEYAFKKSCKNNHLAVAKWLYKLSVKTNNKLDTNTIDIIFKESCEKGHKNIGEWLSTLNRNYEIIYKDRIMIPHIWSIDNISSLFKKNDIEMIDKKISGIKTISADDICMICLSNDSPYWISLDCSHEVCSNCISYISSCPYRCSTEINAKKIKVYKNVDYL
jgi:hypothetical protein